MQLARVPCRLARSSRSGNTCSLRSCSGQKWPNKERDGGSIHFYCFLSWLFVLWSQRTLNGFVDDFAPFVVLAHESFPAAALNAFPMLSCVAHFMQVQARGCLLSNKVIYSFNGETHMYTGHNVCPHTHTQMHAGTHLDKELARVRVSCEGPVMLAL